MKKLTIIIAVLLSGCASPEYLYKPGITQADSNKEASECQLEALKVKASASSYLVGDAYADKAYRLCMSGKGYTLKRS